MDESKRLELILEAVKYCQRVRAMGMPSSCYSKALREPVHFLWERREGRNKEGAAEFRSKAAAGLRFGNGELVYDHAVPFKDLQEKLLTLTDVTADALRSVLSRHCTIVLVTKAENVRLNNAGLGSTMPDGWDGINPLARYEAVGIEIVRNRTPTAGS